MSETSQNTGGFRWGKAVLIGSLALNFLFIGLAGSALVMSKNWGGKEPGFAVGSLGPMMRVLPDERRQELRGVFKERRSAFRSKRRQISLSSVAVIEAITTDPFDRAAFLDAVAKREQAIIMISAESHKVFADVLEKMTLEEREAFAEEAQKLRSKGGKKGGKRGD